MKRILVPCDFSRECREAYKVAIDIASRTNGEITLLHVLYIPTLYSTGYAGDPLAYDPVIFTNMEDDARKELEKMKNSAVKAPIKIDTEVVYGEIVSSIERIIETKKIDIVIMGTTGATGLADVFVGSNTEKIVRHSSVPVLAIRKAPEISSVKKILLPSTLNLDQTEFITNVKELQSFFDATLHILLINTPAHFKRDSEGEEAMEEFAKHYKLKNYKTHFRNYQNEEDGIIDFAYDEQMDLIVMATHGRKGIAHLFYGSIAENVLNRIQSPIWTFCLKK